MSNTDQTKDAIAAALRGVIIGSTGRDVVSQGFVRGVAYCDGAARVSYELPAELLHADLRQELEHQTQVALQGVAGLHDVQVEFAVQPPPRETSDLPGVRHVIAVGAGKGGVGKSTVAVLLAVGLQRRGLKVGLLDADVYGPSIPLMTGTENARPMADPETGRITPPEFDGIKVMSMGYLVPPQQAVVWRGPMAQKYVKEFLDRGDWGELDYLIVDLPPGTGDIPLTLAQSIPLAGAVVVCTPQDVALLDASKAIRMYQKLNVAPLGMVENMSFYCCPNCGDRAEIFGHGGAREAAEAMGVPFLGELPLNLAVRVHGDIGRPQACFTKAPPEVVQALDGIVDRFVAEVESRARRRRPLPQLKVSG